MAPDKATDLPLRSIFDEPYDLPGWEQGKHFDKRLPTAPTEDAIDRVLKDYSRFFVRQAMAYLRGLVE